MLKGYSLSRQARADLQQITHYIANDNLSAARKIKALLEEACANLGRNPYIAQEREDLTDKSVRFWPVHKNYMIIYDAGSDPLRIYNAARDITSVFPI